MLALVNRPILSKKNLTGSNIISLYIFLQTKLNIKITNVQYEFVVRRRLKEMH
jgi:hypothetical protein